MSDIKHTHGDCFKLLNSEHASIYVAHNGQEGQRLMDRDSDSVYVSLDGGYGALSYEEAERLYKHLGQLCQERRRDLRESEKRKGQEKERKLAAAVMNSKEAMLVMFDGGRVLPFNARCNPSPMFYFLGVTGQVMLKAGDDAPAVAEKGPMSARPWDTQWVTEASWREYKGLALEDITLKGAESTF